MKKSIEQIKEEMAINYGYNGYEAISNSYKDGSLNQSNYDLFLDDVVEAYSTDRELIIVKASLMYCAKKVLPVSASLSSELLSNSTEQQISLKLK